MSTGLIPAIDLGGTFIKGGLVGPGARIGSRLSARTLAEQGHRAVTGRIAAMARELAAAATSSGGAPPTAVGLVVPGLVDDERGVAIKAANLDWSDYPICQVLTDMIGLPVRLGHDVAAGALAEYRYGAAAGARVALVVPIGTGLAAGLIHGGQPYRGSHGRTVELGHLRLAWSREPCGCGGTGCVERVASASAIARRYAEAVAAGPGRAGPGGGAADAKAVLALAAGGDPAARRVWADAVRALADGLITLMTVLDPDRIVLAGGLSQAGESLLGPLRQALAERLTFQIAPELVRAQLGVDAGLVGAAITAGLPWEP
ncbi:MAG: ROK family protein [Bifidobacteriaceae bacterium]|jgi:glucokinase|nr:ROK family protein [Bifidobacteriaceae bacterium]